MSHETQQLPYTGLKQAKPRLPIVRSKATQRMDLETLRSKAQRAEISGLMRDAYDHSMSELPGSDFAVSLGTEHLSIPLTDLNRRYFETGSALDHYAMLFSKIALNSTIEIDTIQNDDKPASYVIALFHSAEDK